LHALELTEQAQGMPSRPAGHQQLSGSDTGGGGRGVDDGPGDGTALRGVAVEKGLTGASRGDEGELPAQVVGVLHAGVHPLATDRAVAVRRVPG
jgi:hypothetical protein